MRGNDGGNLMGKPDPTAWVPLPYGQRLPDFFQSLSILVYSPKFLKANASYRQQSTRNCHMAASGLCRYSDLSQNGSAVSGHHVALGFGLCLGPLALALTLALALALAGEAIETHPGSGKSFRGTLRRNLGPSGPWAIFHLRPLVLGPSGPRALGPLCPRVLGPPGPRVFGFVGP